MPQNAYCEYFTDSLIPTRSILVYTLLRDILDNQTSYLAAVATVAQPVWNVLDSQVARLRNDFECEKNVGFLPEFRMGCVQVDAGSGLMPIFKLKIHPMGGFSA